MVVHVAAADTPAITRIAELLRQQRFSESGTPCEFQITALAAGDAMLSITDALSGFPVSPDDGVLVISARPHLAPGGALHRMLQLQEIDGKHIALFGTRAWRPDERALAGAKRIQSYTMIEISREGLSEMTDAVMSYVRTWRRFHLIVDLGAVDPAFAPGVREPVPGGLTARELLYVVQRLRLIKSMGSAVVLVDGEPEGATCLLAAHLIAELA